MCGCPSDLDRSRRSTRPRLQRLSRTGTSTILIASWQSVCTHYKNSLYLSSVEKITQSSYILLYHPFPHPTGPSTKQLASQYYHLHPEIDNKSSYCRYISQVILVKPVCCLIKSHPNESTLTSSDCFCPKHVYSPVTTSKVVIFSYSSPSPNQISSQSPWVPS